MIPLVMSMIAKTETFQRDMAKAGKSVGTFSTTASRTTATITKMGRSLMMMAGVGGGLYMLTRGIRGAIAAGLEQEKVERQLSAAIGGSIVEMKRYAAEMQNQTIYGDELILSQMAYGKNLGITTEQIKDATTAAIGLAAKYRLELNSAMMLVGRAALGQTQMLTRYGIVLDETLDPQDKFNALLKIGADNFYLAQSETKTAAGAMAQFKNNVGDLGEEISMGVLPALTDMLSSVNENKDAWRDFFKVQLAGWAEILSGLKSVQTILETKGIVSAAPQRYGSWAPMPPSEPKGLPVGKLDISPRGYQRLSEMNNRVLEMERAAAKEFEVTKPAAASTEAEDKAAADRAKITARMYSDMGEYGDGYYQAQVAMLDLQKADYAQHVDDKVLLDKWYGSEIQKITSDVADAGVKAAADRVQITARMYSDMGEYGDGYLQAQKALLIQQKADYAQHVDDKVLLEKWYAGEMKKIQEEIRVSNLNAMDNYMEDLEKRLQDMPKKWADTAANIEGAMANAFDSMISEGESFDDAMTNLARDVGSAFSRMISQMISELIMLAVTRAIAGLGGGYSPNYSTTGPTNAGVSPAPAVRHTGWVPEGVPSFQRGRGLKPNEMVAVIEKDELLAPNKQIVKSGGGGPANYEPRFNIIIVRDEKAAQIEAMNSKEGEKSYIRHANRNRRLTS